VIALTDVKLLSVSAQRFIQTLFKDPQLHHRMLQLMVRRLRQTNVRIQRRHQPPAVKLANTLIGLAENYGQPTSAGIQIFNFPHKDLADITDINVEDTAKIMEKLDSKGWIKIDPEHQILCLSNLKQLTHLASRG
jgi:CRP-like cAMP-binding protein